MNPTTDSWFRRATVFARRTGHYAAMLAAIVLAGCATRPPSGTESAATEPGMQGEVGFRLIQPAAEGRHQVARGQAASGGAPVDGDTLLPNYPRDWLARGLPPLRVDARVVVDAQGNPSRVDVDSAPLSALCDACAPAFAAAVADALRQWRFAPLQIADWIDGPDEDGDGEPDSVTRGIVEARPYSLRLQFSFAVRDGEAVVERLP
jgi:hypothetical protein